MGFDIHLELPIVDAVLLGDVELPQIEDLVGLEGVVMIER
jgi:hypothetical protein